MATTRAATFSAKIRTLSEFQIRLHSNQQPPSNAEIITTLRYFQQTLVGFLKDFPPGNAHFCKKFSMDPARWNLYPNLNYSGLFYAIVNLLDVFPIIATGQQVIGEAVLDTLKALMLFLDRDSIEQLPLVLASLLGVFPHELDKQIVHVLADCLFPFAICPDTLVHHSVPGVLMLILHHSSDPSLHTWIVESVMASSQDAYKDIVSLIARGTSESRVSAANLLFHYFPFSNPQLIHRKTIQYRVQAWTNVPCQYNSCPDKAHAVKRCYDPVVCADGADTSPPAFFCKRCADTVIGEKKAIMEHCHMPMPASSASSCQNKSCESSSRLAVGTCFALDCIRFNAYIPLRLCQECFESVHHGDACDHLRHRGTGVVWGKEIEWDMVEAVVKLLRETATHLEGSEGEGKRPKWLRQLEGGHQMGKDIDRMADERRMLSRFGVWLLAALTPPSPEANPKAIGYIMTTLFQWFATTALLPNDTMGASLEQLKTDFVCDWISTAIKNHYEVFIESLSPASREEDERPAVEQTKEALGRLLALMPYDTISAETWNRVMPKWLQFIYENAEEEQIMELKVLLAKIFEPDLCPLNFDLSTEFQFISRQLVADNYDRVFDALQWLHMLSRMEIAIPLSLLLQYFRSCLQNLPTLELPPIGENDLEAEELSIHVVVIDVLVLQVRLNELSTHEKSALSDNLFATMSTLLDCPMHVGPHCCSNPEKDEFADCNACQQTAFVHQMLMLLTETVSPNKEQNIKANEDDGADALADEPSTSTSQPSALLSPHTASTAFMEPMSGQNTGATVSPLECQEGIRFQTATVEMSNEDEFVGILPTEEVEMEMAQAVTLTETDCGRETCQVVTSTLIEGKGAQVGTPSTSSAPPSKAFPTDFWDTSVGRFRFSLDELPPQLQLIFSLLRRVENEKDPDVQFFILNTLKYLCLHCEALTNARREYRGFLIWTQERMFVPQLWSMLRSDYLQVGETASLLLLHSITFPSGEEMFWKTIHADFTNEDWTVRFDAIGRAYVMAHMMKSSAVKANKVVQTSLAALFYLLLVSIHDPSYHVAQRALIAVKALPSNTLKLICMCFEAQFDSCIIDRPLIIHAVHTLTNQVPEETTLTYDFFIQRFETLVLEGQLNSKNEETTFVQDLAHSDPMSDLYQRKVGKARAALENALTARSLVRHLKAKSFPHQLLTKIGDQPEVAVRRCLRPRRGRLSAAALSCRMKIQKVVTMVRVVSRWRDMAASWTVNAASLVSLIAKTSAPAVALADSANNNRMSCKKPETESAPGVATLTSPTYSAGGGFGRLREFTDEESNMCLLLNRVVDMENPERHTVYLCISLFVAFLCNKKASPTDEKQNAKKQSLLFRHFNTLLGYSNTEKCFTLPPSRLRKSAVCNAFLSGLPEILDSNLIIGNQLLPTVVQLLAHLPSPQKLASDQHAPSFSLTLLPQHSRHLWLNTLTLILYKYRFDTVPISDGVVKLINIVLRTLEAQAHLCAEEGDSAEQCAGWGDISSEEESGPEQESADTVVRHPSTMARPESLTVTCIAEQAEPLGEVVFERVTVQDRPFVVQPKILEPKPSTSRRKKKSADRFPQKTDLKSRKPKGPPQPVLNRCLFCNTPKESFDEETISLSVIALSTFLHREPAMAAPLLFRILHSVTKLIDQPLYPWHCTDMFVPANCRSVAKQMLRVVLHQLSSSGIALQLFDSPLPRNDSFWHIISISLPDFNDLSPVYFIQLLLEDMAEWWPANLTTILRNLSVYITEVAYDSYIAHWSSVCGHLEIFFRKYHTVISAEGAKKPTKGDLHSAIIIISHMMKVQNFSSFKSAVSLVESFSKWLAESLRTTPVGLEPLLTVCTACNRAMIRERDKQAVSRAVVSEMIHAIKFKCPMQENNLMTIAHLILQDSGEDIEVTFIDDQFNTSASEAVRPFLFEILDFISDLHVLAKLKKETRNDSVGGDLKVSLAEVIAVEMSRSNARDCRTVIRFIPWLMSPPSVTQAAAGAFADSVTNVRVLSWLLLGALHASAGCLPVPIECSQHMADYIHFVLAGFADQSKQSVVHMSALFHAFHLCQLWTVYCERAAVFTQQNSFSHLLDFWARVTPAILQLLSHSKVLADMVNLHFLNTIQALQQVNSALLCQLYALWAPILTAYHSQIPNQLRIKLDSCENQPSIKPPNLNDWLKTVRYKISQVELQTSAASPYYNV